MKFLLNISQRTPFFEAVKLNEIEIVKLFLSSNINLDADIECIYNFIFLIKFEIFFFYSISNKNFLLYFISMF